MSSNMYDWVTKTWNPLAGECAHRCPYCYMNAMRKRYNNPKWIGEPRIDEKAFLSARFKPNDVVFVQNISDLFAWDVKEADIFRIMMKCRSFIDTGTRFVFQTRNVSRGVLFNLIPDGSFLGTTIDTNRDIGCKSDNKARERSHYLRDFGRFAKDVKRFVTIEPVLKFDIDDMIALLVEATPDFINIGADSKKSGLEEPIAVELEELIFEIKQIGIEIRCKSNLDRILKGAK